MTRRRSYWAVWWSRGEYSDYTTGLDSVWTSKKAACRRRNEAIDEDDATMVEMKKAGRYVPYDFAKDFWIEKGFLDDTDEARFIVGAEYAGDGGRRKTDLQGRYLDA